MTSPDDVLSAVRFHMTQGEVDEAAESLAFLWSASAADRRSKEVIRLHNLSLELADRFPLSVSVSPVLHGAAVAYVQAGDFLGATEMARRMVSVWRGRCQADPTEDALVRHAHALDTLAGVYRARGMPGAVVGCLVELVEWHFVCGNNAGVAWAVRELGALAFLAGDLGKAAQSFTRADEIYAEDAADIEVARERAECHVLLGRLAHAEGDRDAARHWFEKALGSLTDDAAQEAQGLVAALDAGNALPDPVVLKVGEFGCPNWETAETSRRTGQPAVVG